MNILVLSNAARGYYRFFNSLAETFSSDGHEIIFAVDCEFSKYTNYLDDVQHPVYIYSIYFASQKPDHKILNRYKNNNLNGALLADYDRARVFNPWGKRSTEYYDTLKSSLLSFYEKIFDTHHIDAVIYENVSGAFISTARLVAETRNAKFIGISSSRLPNRFYLSNDPLRDHEKIENTFNLIANGTIAVEQEISEWCSDYLRNIETTVPDYMKFNALEKTNLLSRHDLEIKLRTWTGSIKYIFSDSDHAFNVGNPFLRKLRGFNRAIGRKIKSRFLTTYYSNTDNEERYILYPLHYHPEASTSVLAGSYLDEYEVIRNIAFNLPEGTILYVKDHVSAYGFPSLNFYRDVARLPNVKILSPLEPTKELIRGCIAVITLTSTVGYEALLMGKRVFLFGNVFYQFHRNVVKIENPSDLFNMLTKWLRRPVNTDPDYTLKFVEAYYKSTHHGFLNFSGRNAPSLARDVYPVILGEINKRKLT